MERRIPVVMDLFVGAKFDLDKIITWPTAHQRLHRVTGAYAIIFLVKHFECVVESIERKGNHWNVAIVLQNKLTRLTTEQKGNKCYVYLQIPIWETVRLNDSPENRIIFSAALTKWVEEWGEDKNIPLIQ